MQAYTHFLSGIILAQLLLNYNIVVKYLIIFLSHYLLDAVAIITYHPSSVNFSLLKRALGQRDLTILGFEEKYWLAYHSYTYIISLIIFIKFAPNFFYPC